MMVDPKEAVMVGDTRADTEMGKKANLGCTIGEKRYQSDRFASWCTANSRSAYAY